MTDGGFRVLRRGSFVVLCDEVGADTKRTGVTTRDIFRNICVCVREKYYTRDWVLRVLEFWCRFVSELAYVKSLSFSGESIHFF